MSVCCGCCVLSLRRADHSSGGVLPTVVRRCVWSRNLVNEEDVAHWRLSRQKQTNLCILPDESRTNDRNMSQKIIVTNV